MTKRQQAIEDAVKEYKHSLSETGQMLWCPRQEEAFRAGFEAGLDFYFSEIEKSITALYKGSK